MPLKLAQEFFHKEDYSSIVAVKLSDTELGEAFKTEVENRNPDLIALKMKNSARATANSKYCRPLPGL